MPMKHGGVHKGYELQIRYRMNTGPVEQGSKVDERVRAALHKAATEAKDAIETTVGSTGGSQFEHEVKIGEWP